MSGGLKIRTILRDDIAAWDDLWVQYLAYYEVTLNDEARENTFARILDPATKLSGFLALDGDRPVGLVHFLFHDHFWRPDGICYLQDLFTAPDARGTGVGRALIEAVYAAADQAAVSRVYWLTQDFNKTARHLYDRVAKLTPFIRYDRP